VGEGEGFPPLNHHGHLSGNSPGFFKWIMPGFMQISFTFLTGSRLKNFNRDHDRDQKPDPDQSRSKT
jgi:hypothetical protein